MMHSAPNEMGRRAGLGSGVNYQSLDEFLELKETRWDEGSPGVIPSVMSRQLRREGCDFIECFLNYNHYMDLSGVRESMR
jgi:hypothetical protein